MISIPCIPNLNDCVVDDGLNCTAAMRRLGFVSHGNLAMSQVYKCCKIWVIWQALLHKPVLSGMGWIEVTNSFNHSQVQVFWVYHMIYLIHVYENVNLT